LAQMETRAEHPEPYYWAGFVLVGDAGETIIGMEQTQRWLLWAGVGLVVVLVGAAAFWWRHRRHSPAENVLTEMRCDQ
jgi:LPXTG-motif cell wall-anchored protein